MIKLKKETIHVNSKAIKKADYNYDDSLLKLTFANGARYNYHNVTPETFLSMKYSKSIGNFLNKYVLRNYTFTHDK